jgi:hypothetical protein
MVERMGNSIIPDIPDCIVRVLIVSNADDDGGSRGSGVLSLETTTLFNVGGR